jgi:hypothetical protein
MKEVYIAVKALLKANVPGLAQITRWNNQLDTESTAAVQTFPAIYYQLDGLKTTTLTKGVQQAEGILRIRHCSKALRDTELTGADMEASSYLALQRFKGGPITTGLDRTGIYPDNNYGALEVIISEYHIKYTDASLLNSEVIVLSGSNLGSETNVTAPNG